MCCTVAKPALIINTFHSYIIQVYTGVYMLYICCIQGLYKFIICMRGRQYFVREGPLGNRYFWREGTLGNRYFWREGTLGQSKREFDTTRSFMMNKKWTLEEEFNNHMLRFQQVKCSLLISPNFIFTFHSRLD